MNKINVKQQSTAKKYAEALFDIAQAQSKADIVLSDLKFVEETFASSEELRQFFENPIYAQKDKKEVLQQLFETRTEQITLNLLYLLVDNSRLDLLSNIAYEFSNILLENTGTVTVKAISAIVMKDYLKEKLRNKLETLLSKKVQIEYTVNPEIIAGLIVEIDGKTIDNSVQTKIKNIKKQLI